jgi:type I restriction enzyme M protein
MDSAQIQNTLKALCKVMWDNNVTNPITYVTQISYLLFLKMLEEMDAEYRRSKQKREEGRRVKLYSRSTAQSAILTAGTSLIPG